MAKVHFGSVLDKPKSDKKVWLLAVPLILVVAAGIIWGFSTVSAADSARAELERSKARVTELEGSLEQRDKLLTQAREDESVLKSPGQAASLFAAAAPGATESGVVLASGKAARVYLYGLSAPPAGQQYVVAARGKEGEPKPLGRVLPDEQGNGFLLAKDVPEGTSAIELVFAPASPAAPAGDAVAKADGKGAGNGEANQPPQPGADVRARQEGTGSGGGEAAGGDAKSGDAKGAKPAPPPEPPISLEGATTRLSARFPATPDERGVLAQAPAAQARRAPRR